MFEVINDDNFILYASKYYSNPQCSSIEEFYADLMRFKYIKRLVRRYLSGKALKERLIINHIIVLFNTFGVKPCIKMFLYKFKNEDELSVIKPFLIYMNYMSAEELSNVKSDNFVIERLRRL